MHIAWTRDAKDEKQKEDIINLLKNSTTVFDRQKKILNEIKESFQKQQIANAQYDHVNWEHRQADLNGCIRTVQNIIDLITIK